MANVVISGDTSGAITLAAPAVAGTTTLTLPATTGTLVVTSGAQTIEFADGTVSAPSITNSGDTNTGIFFPAADTIAFTEGGVESVRIDSSGNLLFNSGYGSVATAYGCRAWAAFNGGTNAIFASGNITSISQPSTGNYVVVFATAMVDANYATLPQFQPTATNAGSDSFAINPTTTQVEIRHFEAGTNRSGGYCCVAVFR